MAHPRATVLLISGGIAVGKTTVAVGVALGGHGQLIRVREALAAVAGVDEHDRQSLQREGADLDRRTNGRWLLRYLEEQIEDDLVVIDALRTRRQTKPILDALPNSHLVHLRAHEATRRSRYGTAAMNDPIKANLPFDAAVAHETERSADAIRDLADFVLETDDLTADETIRLILTRYELLGPD
jgi:hypothetical protein